MLVLFKAIAKKAGYGLAAFVLLVALLVCISRLLTPILDKRKDDFEKIASQYLQNPVAIKQVKVSWYQYYPVISLRGLSLLDKASHQPRLKIKNVSILISIPSSLWQRRVVTSGILVSGTHLTISQPTANNYSIRELALFNFPNPAPHTQDLSSKLAEILALISRSPHLILRNIDLHYTDFHGKESNITLLHGNIDNRDTVHRIAMKAVLHQAIPTELTLASKWQGQVFDPKHIQGKLYLYISGFSLKQWMKNYFWQDWQIKDGMVSAKMWANWKHGHIKKIQTNLQSHDVSLYSNADHSSHYIKRLSANLGWKRQGDHFILAGDDILLDSSKHVWPATHFYFVYTYDAKGNITPLSANTGFLDLYDIHSFLKSTPPWIKSDLKINGVLQSANMQFGNPWNDWRQLNHLNVTFTGLSLSSGKNYPSMQNVNGTIKWNQNQSQGELKLNGRHSVLHIPQVFSNDIHFDRLAGHIQFYNDMKTKNWVISTPSLYFDNLDLTADVKGKMILLPGNPIADLSADIDVQQAKHISYYLPNKIFGKDLVDWLSQAFLSGEVSTTQAVLRGPLYDFPFDKQNGEFSINSKIKNMDLKFADDWPVIRQMNGFLTFWGRRINIDIDHAQMLTIPLTGIKGVIPYVGEAQSSILSIKANPIQTNFVNALQYIHRSPLEKNIGKMFAGISMDGDVMLDLGLTIPLSDTDKTKVQGKLDFDDADMHLSPWNLNLTHLKGQVHFTENSTDANRVDGELFNKPLQFSLDTLQKTKTLSVVQAKFTHHINLNDLENWLNIPATKIASGEADIEGKIDFAFNAPLEISIKSNLIGTKINLIEPFSKDEKVAKDFSTALTFQNNQLSQIKLNYDDVNADILLDEKQKDKNWLVNIKSKAILGSLSLPYHFNRQAWIVGQFEKIDLHANDTSQQQDVLDARTLPGISLVVKDTHYNDMFLGRIIFKAIPNRDGLAIQTLQMSSKYMNLQAQGDWEQQDNHAMTHLQGRVTSPRVNRLLRNFNIDVSNAILNEGKLNFDFSWNNPVYLPSLASLNGKANLNLNEGRIIDIGKGSDAKMDIGRMLNIFSLQTIPRRLSLDFSDLFEKGYSFDSLNGDFSIKNGDIYTKNLLFNGPVAKVGIDGRIGLEKKDYDFVLSVVANVTSSIPVAAALLAANPLGLAAVAVGVGAYAVNSVLGPQFSKVTTNYYAVSGPWSNPVWKSV